MLKLNIIVTSMMETSFSTLLKKNTIVIKIEKWQIVLIEGLSRVLVCAASMDEFWVLMCCQYECSLGIDANMDAVKVLMCCQYRYILDIDVLPYGCILNIDVLPVWMQFGYRYPQTRRYWCQCGCLSAVRRGISHKYDRDPSLWVLIWCQYGCCGCWEGCPTNVMYSDLWGR